MSSSWQISPPSISISASGTAITAQAVTTSPGNAAPLLVSGFIETLVYQDELSSVAYAVDNLQGLAQDRPTAITLEFSTTASLLVEQNSTVKLGQLRGSPTQSTQALNVSCEPAGFVAPLGGWARDSGLLSLSVVADTMANSTYKCTVVLGGPLQAQPPPTLSLEVSGTHISRVVPDTPGGKRRPLGLEVWCAPYQAPSNGMVYPEDAVQSPGGVIVTCKEGYLLRKGSVRQNSARATCRSDGIWSSTDVNCERVRGALVVFGRNDKGQLGDGSVVADGASMPAEITLDDSSGVSLVAGGEDHSMALSGNGSLYTWGSNTDSQLGCTATTVNGTVRSPGVRSTPRRVECPGSVFAALNFSMLSAGKSHSVVLGADGSVWSWGNGQDGQLGHGVYDTSDQPVQPTLPVGIRIGGIAAGGAHTLAFVEDGARLYAWGSNSRGQLGDGSTLSRNTPASIPTASAVVKVAAGTQHSFALLKR